MTKGYYFRIEENLLHQLKELSNKTGFKQSTILKTCLRKGLPQLEEVAAGKKPLTEWQL